MQRSGMAGDVDHLPHLGTEPVPPGLVDFVAVCRGEQPRISGGQPGGESGNPAHGADHHLPVVVIGEHSTGLGSGKSTVGHGDDRSEGGVDRETEWQTLSGYQHQPSVHRRRRLIGMTFHFGCDSEDTVGSGLLAMRSQRGRGTRHERRRRRPETPSQGDLVLHFHLERPVAHATSGCGYHTVYLPIPETMLAVVFHRPLVGQTGPHHTPRAEREGETIEGRAEIGRGCWGGSTG